jgi:hypothetical protein
MIKSVFKWTWLVAHLVLFIGVSYFSFSRNYGLLSYGVDGAMVLVHTMYQWIWAPAAVARNMGGFCCSSLGPLTASRGRALDLDDAYRFGLHEIRRHSRTPKLSPVASNVGTLL